MSLPKNGFEEFAGAVLLRDSAPLPDRERRIVDWIERVERKLWQRTRSSV